MSLQLEQKLESDLRYIGISNAFSIEVRPYSKTLYGRYLIKDRKIVLYQYRDKELLNSYSYEELLMTAVHEAIHCIQWSDPLYIRCKGIMHDPEFYSLYQKYSERAKALLFFREVSSFEKRSKDGGCTLAS